MDLFNIDIAVTDDIIARGKRSNCTYCPVALALMEAVNTRTKFTRLMGVSVGRGSASIYTADNEPPYIQYGTDFTKKVWSWIDRFDAGEPVEPFKTTLTFIKDAAEILL